VMSMCAISGSLFRPVRGSAPTAEATQRRPSMPIVARCCKGHQATFGTARRHRCGHFAAIISVCVSEPTSLSVASSVTIRSNRPIPR
jgi:hypothetical protein